jgi:hypothetical protein
MLLSILSNGRIEEEKRTPSLDPRPENIDRDTMTVPDDAVSTGLAAAAHRVALTVEGKKREEARSQ